MAIKMKGNLNWVLQENSRKPVEDEFGLYTAEEVWAGKASDFEGFRAIIRPPGAAHAQYPWMKVGKVDDPVYRAGEMAECRVRYFGNPQAISNPMPNEIQTLRKNQSLGGEMQQWGRQPYAVVYQTHNGPWQYNYTAPVLRKKPAEEEIEFFTRATVYKYCRPAHVTAAQWVARATVDIGSLTPEVISRRMRISPGFWEYGPLVVNGETLPEGQGWYATSAAVFVPDETNAFIPTLVCTSLTSTPAERSGWYRVEEVWEWAITSGIPVT